MKINRVKTIFLGYLTDAENIYVQKSYLNFLKLVCKLDALVYIYKRNLSLLRSESI